MNALDKALKMIVAGSCRLFILLDIADRRHGIDKHKDLHEKVYDWLCVNPPESLRKR